jgi:MoxR-like ATPase
LTSVLFIKLRGNQKNNDIWRIYNTEKMGESTKLRNTMKAYHPSIERLVENIEKVMIGKEREIILSIVALLAKGHVLLEDVPGVGKTMLIRTLAKSVNAEFKRIQFTPDLLPSDVTGTSIYNPKSLDFEYRKGPIVSNIVLADEINRTSPKTQSALLEAMEEGSVTVDGDTKILPKPFFVMATQNPIDYEGTFPLPEAQLDRFLLKINLGYPSEQEEMEVLSRSLGEQTIDEIHPVLTLDDVIELQELVKKVYVDQNIRKYIVEIVNKTREHASVYMGVSPRGSLALMKASQAFAFINGRDYVIPDDVKFLSLYTLPHRMIVKSEVKFSGTSQASVIKEIIESVQVPINKDLNYQ